MRTLEVVVLTAFGLIALFLVLNQQRTVPVIGALAGGAARIFTVLQGRNGGGLPSIG